MTVSPEVPPLAAANLAEAVSALRGQGLRLSTSRRLILEALFTADGPVSAEWVARQLKLDPASVHRNFEALERHGLVRHVHLGHGPGLYALLGRGEREYLFCERCGAVRALAPEELDPVRLRIRERYGYEARFDHFAIVGLCPQCATPAALQAAPHLSTSRRPAPADASHEHEHSHGDHVHSHAHVHRHGPGGQHGHAHGD